MSFPDFKVLSLSLSSQKITATGDILYVNGQPVGASGSFYPLNSNPSGYITSSQTGAFGGSANTGSLTGIFYPLNSNPSGYASTGNYVDVIGTGAVTVITGNGVLYISGNGSAVNTGNLTGVFYPLNANPSGYITPSQTGAFGGAANTGILTGVFYPLNSNPSNYITTGQTGTFGGTTNIYNVNSGTGLFIFRSGLHSGISEQFVNFPSILDFKPYVIATLHNDLTNQVIPMQISGAVSTGFWAILTDVTDNTGYYLDVVAANSTQTGMATNVIVYNNVSNSSWTSLTWNNPLTWSVATGILEERKLLSLTGSTTLILTGLYNGWNGVLKVTQMGSGFTLGLPSGTKVINNASGVVHLTTGISGAIDVLGFEYDGTHLMVGVGNNFN